MEDFMVYGIYMGDFKMLLYNAIHMVYVNYNEYWSQQNLLFSYCYMELPCHIADPEYIETVVTGDVRACIVMGL